MLPSVISSRPEESGKILAYESIIAPQSMTNFQFLPLILTRLRFAVALFVSLSLVGSVGISRRVLTSARPEPQAVRIGQELDLLILHGKLVDGSGGKPRPADIGIRGDRIVFIGDARKEKFKAIKTIDATGLVVAPGFIDPHTHTLGDLSDEKRKGNEAYLMQGVTTVVTGNDGESALNIGETLARWDKQGIGTNAILLSGFGTIRAKVLGATDAQPNTE